MMRLVATSTPPPSPPAVRTSTHHGVAILGPGSAIVSARRDDADRVHVTAIERLAPDIATVVRRLRQLEADDPECYFHIGAMGSGRALWDTLHMDYKRRWSLFDKRGVERQELVDGMLSAEAEERLSLDPSLSQAAAMKKALAGMTREVGVDGVIGGELVVALALVVVGRRRPAPQIW